MKGPPLDPKGPCPYLPGSEGRVQTYMRRATKGYAMNHPGDVTLEDLHTVQQKPYSTGDGANMDLRVFRTRTSRRASGLDR